MRVRATSSSASRVPNSSAPFGQTSAHAGISPRAWRSTQNSHFVMYGMAFWYSNFGTSNGHAIMQ